LRFVVVRVRAEQTGSTPYFDRRRAKTEGLRGLGHGEQAPIAQPLVARPEAVALTDTADHHGGDQLAGAGAEAALRQDARDLPLGVGVQQAIDFGNDLGARLAQGPRGQ